MEYTNPQTFVPSPYTAHTHPYTQLWYIQSTKCVYRDGLLGGLWPLLHVIRSENYADAHAGQRRTRTHTHTLTWVTKVLSIAQQMPDALSLSLTLWQISRSARVAILGGRKLDTMHMCVIRSPRWREAKEHRISDLCRNACTTTTDSRFRRIELAMKLQWYLVSTLF